MSIESLMSVVFAKKIDLFFWKRPKADKPPNDKGLFNLIFQISQYRSKTEKLQSVIHEGSTL